MLTLKEIVNSLTCTRAEFASQFLQAQIRSGVLDLDRIQFDALVVGISDDKAAYEMALSEAKIRNFFKILLIGIINSGLDNGQLSASFIEGEPRGELQAMYNDAAGFTEPVLFSKGILKTSQITGKVLLNGEPKGTGVLIGPNLFLTAWHVLEEMFDKVPALEEDKIEYIEKRSPPQLQVEFNNFLDIVNGVNLVAPSTRVNAHENWMVHYSACDASELIKSGKLMKITEGFWDYAIIRLASTIGSERRWVTLSKQITEPQPTEKIVLFQHPVGITMKMDQSEVVDWFPNEQNSKKLRFLHSVNTLPGSSGGPCFDKSFDLVGIHQGEWPYQINGKTANRAIPICAVIDDYLNKIASLPVPDAIDCRLWCLNKENYEPVIGCDEFQSQIWESTITGTNRLIRINGYGKTGKTFHIDVANAILNDADHLKLQLPGDLIASLEVTDLARFICKQAGALLPNFSTPEQYNSTISSWLKDEIVFKTIAILSEKRSSRMVWLFFSEMNKYTFEDKRSQDFLHLMMENLRYSPWLRIVVDGFQGKIPLSINNITLNYLTHQFLATEIESFLERAYTDLNKSLGNATKAFAQFQYLKYQKALMMQPNEALKELAEDCTLFLTM